MGTAAAPAGFWRRYAAWSLDWALLSPLLAFALAPMLARAWLQAAALNQLLQDWVAARVIAADGAFPSPVAMAFELLADPVLGGAAREASARLGASLWQLLAIVLGAGALYFIAGEASAWQGTPGKRLLGLRVHRLDGSRPGLLRVAARHVAGALSWLMLNLGHAIVAWREDHRALHDLLAGTQVLAHAPMPRWARAWLGLQGGALAALLLGTLGWFGWQLLQLLPYL